MREPREEYSAEHQDVPWHYEHKGASRKAGFSPGKAVNELFRNIFLFIAFTALPFILLFIIDWALFSFFKNTYYDEPWMRPMILLASAFFAGVFSRQMMEENMRSMGLFVVGIIGFCTFAWLVYQDIDRTGALFSAAFLPVMLKNSLTPYVFATPITAIIGMMFFKIFSLRP